MLKLSDFDVSAYSWWDIAGERGLDFIPPSKWVRSSCTITKLYSEDELQRIIDERDREIAERDARIAELEALLARETERADYGWKTAAINDRARMDEMAKRDKAEAKLKAMEVVLESARWALIEANSIVEETWDCSRTIEDIDEVIGKEKSE